LYFKLSFALFENVKIGKMAYFYDFLSLSTLFSKVALIHDWLFEALRAFFSLFKSAKVNFNIQAF